ncbi:hypothetical protein BJ508DRAFT_140759 [Ascobolus immersus RN42]|uniref:Uncharacterized protein n=1 Tax=Ascobolus immersus RN42 TaxID=1160509 RepID=A0A3N4I0A3_ASCIM|nr:hypothetical protein BJ508DRAFT_140759 [Ascobolus immersus RN42]
MEDSRQKNYGILNLVKAAWILVDVVVLHPQLSYLDASMQFEIRTLSVTIKEEFKACRINGFTKPPLDSFGERDLRIWDNKEDVSNFKLRPASSSYNVTARSWAANDEHILFQGFAIYKEIPCVVFFLVHEKNFHPRVLLLSQNGTILEEQRIETSPPFSDEYTPLEKLLGFTTHKFCYSYSRRRIKPSDADNEYGIDLFFPSKLTFNSVQDARRLLIRLLGLNEFIRYHSFGRIKYTRENLLVFMLLAAMLIQSDRTHTDELLAAIQSSSNYPHWDKSQLHTAVPLLIASTELASAFVMEEFFPSRYNYPFIGYRLDSYPNDSQMGLFLCLFSDARHSKFWRTRQAFMDCVAGVIFGEYKEVSDYWREWWLNFVANAISSGNAEALRFYCATFNVLSQNIPKQSHSWGTKERTAEAQSELYQYIIQEILACNPNMLTDFIGSTRIPLQELTISQPDLIRNVIVHIACCTDTSESYLSALENLANALGLHTASSDYKSSTSSACIPGEDFYSIALCVLLHDISEVKVDSVKFLLSKGANPNFLCNHSRSSPPCQVCDKTGKGKYGIYGWHTPTASAVLSDFQPREHILDLLLLVGGKLDFFYVEMPAYRERYPTRKEVALLTPSRSSMYESLNDAIDLAQKLVRTELAVQVENAEQTDVEFLRSTFRGFEVRHFSVLGCLDFQYQELTDRLDVKSLDPVPEETEWLLPRRALLLRKGAYNILLGSKLVAPSVSALDKIRSRFFERFFPNFRTCSAQISTSASILQVSEDSWCQWHEIVEESFSFKIDPERVPMYPYSFKTGSARSDCISALPSRHYSSSAFQLHHIDRSQSAQRKDGISKYYSKSKNGFKQEDYEYGNMNLNITFVSPLLYWLTNWTTLIKSFKELRVDPYMYRDLRPDEGPTVEEVD